MRVAKRRCLDARACGNERSDGKHLSSTITRTALSQRAPEPLRPTSLR